MLTYNSPIIKTPYGKKELIFADDTASGRPSPIIDKLIEKKIIPYYSNTHSNSFCGMYMSNYINKFKEFIKKHFELDNRHKIIFTGNGVTGAINHLSNSIDTNQYKTVNIFISMFEHFSNHIPWLELSKHTSNVKLHVIPINENEDIDLNWLDNMLKNNQDCSNLNIISLIACSNVTGIKLDIVNIHNLVNKFNDNQHKINYLLYDIASLAPHEFISGKYFDGIFISGHKYLGGPSTPGVLIADENLFRNGKPYAPGGGCVAKMNKIDIEYESDIEIKESAGTPNILGIIRLYYCMTLLIYLQPKIKPLEEQITKYVYNKFNDLSKKYKLTVVSSNKNLSNRLPIVSFSVKNIHFNLMVVLLNDLFGIQSRGGISCSGLFSQYIYQKYKFDGWCRITFNWMMSKKTIDYIINAVEHIILNIDEYKNNYIQDPKENIFIYNKLK